MHLYKKNSVSEPFVVPEKYLYKDVDKNVLAGSSTISYSIDYCSVFGDNNNIQYGFYTFVAGFSNTVIGSHNVVLGKNNKISGSIPNNLRGNTVFGGNNEIIDGAFNHFGGISNRIKAQGTAVFGVAAKEIPFEFIAKDLQTVEQPRLIVGNGTTDFAKSSTTQDILTTSNAFVVLQSGAVSAPSLTVEMLDALDVDQKMLITKEHLDAYVTAKISEIPIPEPLDFAQEMATVKFGYDDTFAKYILIYPDFNDIKPARGVNFRRDAVNQIPYNDLPIVMNTPLLVKLNYSGGLDAATFKVDILEENTASIGYTSFNSFTDNLRLIKGYDTITSNSGSDTFMDEVKVLQNDVQFIEVEKLNWELADANAPLIFELSAPFAWAQEVTWQFDVIVDKIVFTDPYNDVVTEYINTDGHEYFKLITEGDYFGDSTHLAVWKDGVENYIYFGSSASNVLNKSTGF